MLSVVGGLQGGWSPGPGSAKYKRKQDEKDGRFPWVLFGSLGFLIEGAFKKLKTFLSRPFLPFLLYLVSPLLGRPDRPAWAVLRESQAWLLVDLKTQTEIWDSSTRASDASLPEDRITTKVPPT